MDKQWDKDIMADFSEEKNNEYIKKYSIDSSMYGKLLHSEVGYYWALENGYSKEICNAIRYHTLGYPGMDMYAKVIMIADKIGRNLKNDVLDRIRLIAYKNLDDAIILYLEDLESRLKEKDIKMHPWSLDLLEELRS